MNGNTDIELQLGPDFAARVLDAADRLIARRRRRRRVATASVLCAGIAAAGVWLDLAAEPRSPARTPNPMLASVSLPETMTATGARSADRDVSPDALSWFFPDAEPLDRYAADDAPDDSGESAGTLFAGDQ